MTPQEQQLIADLFERLGRADGPRDPEAERFIAERMAANPGAAYAMAQTIVVQDHALKSAEARISGLEKEIAAAKEAGSPASRSGGSFAPWTGSDLPAARGPLPAGGGLPQSRNAVPSQPVDQGATRFGAGAGMNPGMGAGAGPAGGPAGWSGGPSVDGRAATSVPSFGGRSSGMGGFLSGAGQIALGVVGGALLADAARSMFSGFGGTSPTEEVVNNETIIEEPAAASPWGDAAGGDQVADAGRDGGAWGNDVNAQDPGGQDPGGQDPGSQDPGSQDPNVQDAGYDPGQDDGGQDQGWDAGGDLGGGDDSSWI